MFADAEMKKTTFFLVLLCTACAPKQMTTLPPEKTEGIDISLVSIDKDYILTFVLKNNENTQICISESIFMKNNEGLVDVAIRSRNRQYKRKPEGLIQPTSENYKDLVYRVPFEIKYDLNKSYNMRKIAKYAKTLDLFLSVSYKRCEENSIYFANSGKLPYIFDYDDVVE